MSKWGGVILILTGIGAAAYVMPRGYSPGDSGPDRHTVDVAIAPSAQNAVKPARELVQPAARNLATSPVVTASIADVAANASIPAPTTMPRPTGRTANTVLAQAKTDGEPTVRKISPARPADSDMRVALTRDLQRELRRVGCYDGEIDGHWGTGSRAAMKTFTERVNATLPLDEPDGILLALVQGQKDKVCDKCPAGQGFAENGRCLPSALLAHAAAKRALSKGEPSASWNTRVIAERIKPATTTWTTTSPVGGQPTPAAPIEGRMGVGGPSADTPSPSNASGGDDRSNVAGVPPVGTQSDDPSRASHSAHAGRFAPPRATRQSAFGPSFFAQRESERK